SVALHRQKREWVVPPKILEENVDYTKSGPIARIRSDKEEIGRLRYSLSGIGADMTPYNLFVVDASTGEVRITGILDREEIAQYNISGKATFVNRTEAENIIQLRIKVKDQNDNSPIFPTDISPGSVYELSASDSSVMTIRATDRDEPGNINSQILYEIINQEPAGKRMFKINRNGEIRVSGSNLDREANDRYALTIKASDLNGAPGCLTGTARVIINILDVNDNIPTLERESYECSIEENTEDLEVMRIKAKDLDLVGTENWLAKFFIVTGNEAGHFSIYTDPNTNEGVLVLNKAVDYEEIKNMNLGLAVSNVAPYHPSVEGGAGTVSVVVSPGGAGDGTGAGGGAGAGAGSPGHPGSPGSPGGKLYNVNVNVKNQPEGPVFKPKVKAIPISEDGKMFDITKIIAKYPAIDGDTKLPAENVRYVKGADPDNWLSIDDKTGDIRLNKLPDRESPHLKNGTYTAKILCITQDIPSKTATGTIAIQVEDFNDHCPRLTSLVQDMCTIQGALYVSAMDEDPPPNGIPFTFSIVPEKTQGKWSIEHLNDTTAILRTQETLWPGPKEVTVQVHDQQGLSCPEPQVLKVDVCTCDISGHCSPDVRKLKGSVLGGAGISLILLGLLMLLLIPLLLLSCQCGKAGFGGGFADMPFDTKEHLISYNTEGQGEDRDVPLYIRPGTDATDVGGCTENGHWMNGQFMNNQWVTNHLGINQTVTDRTNMAWKDDGLALSEQFLNHYYSGKCQELDSTAMNSLLVYNEEGRGSPAGSVSSLSFLDSGNDLEFLNDLESKFTTLAEICGGTKFMTAISAPAPAAAAAAAPTPTPAPVLAPPRPRPTIEAVSTNINTINAVNTTSTVNTASAISAHARPAQPSSVHVERNVVVNDSHTSIVTDATPAQTVLVQQQPLYYVVEPQVPSTVLLTERPAVGLGQGMYVLNGAEGVLVQGSVGAQNTGLLRSANLSGSQVLLVERGAQGGQILQGTLQRGGPTSSQGLLLVEAQGGSVIDGALKRGFTTAGGLHVEGAGGSSGIVHGSQQRGMTTSSWSQSETVGLNGNSYQVSGLPTSRKVVIQEKKVVSSQGNL
uniref:Cadherin domain-containing protein n=1 Tax=Electrophorus electricus TaxID=8005 RepID=A0AAY5F2M2_ELEEL